MAWMAADGAKDASGVRMAVIQDGLAGGLWCRQAVKLTAVGVTGCMPARPCPAQVKADATSLDSDNGKVITNVDVVLPTGFARTGCQCCCVFMILCCCVLPALYCSAQVGADGTSLEADNGEVITDVDIIVFATGFDVAAPLAQFDIRAHGATLNETFDATPEAYYGMAVAGFPNLFTLLGPNTGTTRRVLHVTFACVMMLRRGISASRT